jgi:hypothetical protein
MDEWIRWAVASIIGILGILVGRTWERHDHRVQKDRDLLKKFLEFLPSDGDTIMFLRQQDFGGEFNREFILKLARLRTCETQPDFFFLNKKLEDLRVQLFAALNAFLSESAQKVSAKDNPDYYSVSKPHEVLQHRSVHLLDGRRWADLSQEERTEINSQLEIIRVKAEDDFKETTRTLNIQASRIVQIYDELIRESRIIL